MTMTSKGDSTVKAFVVIMVIGLLGIVTLIGVRSRLLSNEYPDLTLADSLNDIVCEVYIKRSSAYVTFRNKRKYHFIGTQNLAYPEHISLSGLISIGDVISKAPNSDTIFVSHSGKKYFYVFNPY